MAREVVVRCRNTTPRLVTGPGGFKKHWSRTTVPRLHDVIQGGSGSGVCVYGAKAVTPASDTASFAVVSSKAALTHALLSDVHLHILASDRAREELLDLGSQMSTTGRFLDDVYRVRSSLHIFF